MQKCMWIVLIIALLALALALLSLYQTMRFTKTTYQSVDSSVTFTGTQIVPKTDTGAKDPGIHWTTTEYSPVSEGEFWEKRGEFDGKKIVLTTMIDTNTMILQPESFPSPIHLDSVDASTKSMWPTNQGIKVVEISGVFYLGKVRTGSTEPHATEGYEIRVNQMSLLESPEKAFYIWPDKRTPTLEMGAGTLSGLQPEVLEQLNNKPVIYQGQYVAYPPSYGMLDDIVAVKIDTLGNPEILKQLGGTKTRVKVWGVLHLKQNWHGATYMLDAGKIELVTDATQKNQITSDSYSTVTSQELWDRRSDLHEKKISLTVEIDTDTMLFQPVPFTSPIELTQDPEIDYLVDQDLWPRNMGKQIVTIRGTFSLQIWQQEIGGTRESYSIVVDSLSLQSQIAKEQAIQIAHMEAGKRSNATTLIQLEVSAVLKDGDWHVAFLAPLGKGDTVGGGLPEYIISANTGEVLSELLQR